MNDLLWLDGGDLRLFLSYAIGFCYNRTAADAYWCVCPEQYVQTCVECFTCVYWWVCASGLPLCAPRGPGHGLLLILCESRYGALLTMTYRCLKQRENTLPLWCHLTGLYCQPRSCSHLAAFWRSEKSSMTPRFCVSAVKAFALDNTRLAQGLSTYFFYLALIHFLQVRFLLLISEPVWRSQTTFLALNVNTSSLTVHCNSGKIKK